MLLLSMHMAQLFTIYLHVLIPELSSSGAYQVIKVHVSLQYSLLQRGIITNINEIHL